MKQYKKAIFIFRRDLRLDDNNGLLEAIRLSDTIIPLFILDPRQTTQLNPYKSDCALQFMAESLIDLHEQLIKKNGTLYLMSGVAHTEIEKIIHTTHADAIFCNRDYTPFSLNRDSEIEKICKKKNIDFILVNDTLLIQPEHITTATKNPYNKFTPFFKKASFLSIDYPKSIAHCQWFTGHIADTYSIKILDQFCGKENFYVAGGRKNGLNIISKIKNFKEYSSERDFPALNKTTHLSAHHKFGTISIRETYHAITRELSKKHSLITQLFWRDFFTHIAWHYPHIFKTAFQKKFSHLKWNNNEKHFQSWCAGKTGFPIVDAGMRQLNETGFMHNRVRMITASFLVKDLHINWQWGEQYFAQKLIDYDPAVNNGNWQWVASTGCDAQPYFRIFNPWLQQKKFDPQAQYIKEWVPELKKVPATAIHAILRTPLSSRLYYKPIIDHADAVKITKKIYIV